MSFDWFAPFRFWFEKKSFTITIHRSTYEPCQWRVEKIKKGRFKTAKIAIHCDNEGKFEIKELS